jgi:hypothetical protein
LSNRRSLRGWAAVAAVLIFAGLASALVPFLLDKAKASNASAAAAPKQAQETTIDVGQLPFIGEVLVDIPVIKDKIQGQPISMLTAFGIAMGVVLVSVGGAGILITGVVSLFDKQVNRVYENEDYQTAAAALQGREKAQIVDLRRTKPTNTSEGKARSRGPIAVYAFIALILVWIVGKTLSSVYLVSSEVTFLGLTFSGGFVLNLILGLLTIALLYLALRKRTLDDVENPASDNNPVNWGLVWVTITGLLIVGLGAGAALMIIDCGIAACTGG